MNTNPIIKKRINHDSMWISCKFPSGESFKLKILRYKTVLNHDLGEGGDIILKWSDNSGRPTYGEMFNKLEALCLVCNTGKDLINLIQKDYGNRS